MMQLYDITIAANTTRQLDAPGSYFYYYAGSAGGADSTITLRGLSSGLRIILKPGQAFRLPAGQIETSWVLTNLANVATIIGSVIVGDGDITDNRVTGSVEVVDGEKYRTMAGGMFVASSYSPAAAGNYSFVQLWNPAGSGKNLIVGQIGLSTSLASAINIYFSNSQHASLNSAPQRYQNKLSGSASIPVAQARYKQSAIFETFPMGLGWSPYCQANNMVPWPIKGALVVQPGYGMNAVAAVQNTDLVMNCEWFEENI